MAKHRVGRVSETVKEEISQILHDELKDPRIGFVTVTGADVASDLGHAKVFVSIMGSSEQVKESIIALNRAAGFVRTELGKRVRLRHTPELVFKLDSSIEQGVRIAALLDEVLEQEHREQEKE